jgi:hypothetical protein
LRPFEEPGGSFPSPLGALRAPRPLGKAARLLIPLLIPDAEGSCAMPRSARHLAPPTGTDWRGCDRQPCEALRRAAWDMATRLIAPGPQTASNWAADAPTYKVCSLARVRFSRVAILRSNRLPLASALCLSKSTLCSHARASLRRSCQRPTPGVVERSFQRTCR